MCNGLHLFFKRLVALQKVLFIDLLDVDVWQSLHLELDGLPVLSQCSKQSLRMVLVSASAVMRFVGVRIIQRIRPCARASRCAST